MSGAPRIRLPRPPGLPFRRGAAAVGAGLQPAREARPIEPGERIHVVGVAGAGASAAALLARRAGALPSGCDRGGPSPYTPPLEQAEVPLAWRHDPAHVTGSPPGRRPTRLAVTKALTAIEPDHPELEAARRAGIPLEPWQQVIADAAVGRILVGVAGTHGKSTTAGWLVHLLFEAGADPSAFVGALLPGLVTGGLPATARWGAGDAFVVEADEYAGNFDPYRPALAVLTTVDWDHPDVFADRAAVVACFEEWLRAAAEAAGVDHSLASVPGVATPQAPLLVANVADAGVADVVERLADWPGRVLATALLDTSVQRRATYRKGLGQRFATALGPADVLLGRVQDSGPDGTLLELDGLDPLRGRFQTRLRLAGRHNAANALGVAGAALHLGTTPEAIVEGLASFEGVGRRLERKGEAGGVVVYDDYGHHPTAIEQTLLALRQREPGRRIWAVYEPLTFHRTAAMLGRFAEVLATADAVAVADIWAGRDPDTTIASAAALAEAVAGRRPGIPVAAPGSVEQTAAWLLGEVRPGDAVLVMGGGRSYRIAELLLEGLAER
ncbi:MAG TPA: cyanophycin synthetase [Candidatus Limnocylindrales bacterium]